MRGGSSQEGPLKWGRSFCLGGGGLLALQRTLLAPPILFSVGLGHGRGPPESGLTCVRVHDGSCPLRGDSTPHGNGRRASICPPVLVPCREKTKPAKASQSVEDGPEAKKAKLDFMETTLVKKVGGESLWGPLQDRGGLCPPPPAGSGELAGLLFWTFIPQLCVSHTADCGCLGFVQRMPGAAPSLPLSPRQACPCPGVSAPACPSIRNASHSLRVRQPLFRPRAPFPRKRQAVAKKAALPSEGRSVQRPPEMVRLGGGSTAEAVTGAVALLWAVPALPGKEQGAWVCSGLL